MESITMRAIDAVLVWKVLVLMRMFGICRASMRL